MKRQKCQRYDLYNPNFKVVEFDHFKQEAGLPTFTMSVTDWVDNTNAVGLYVKKGRYGGTFAHKDIVFEFASAISSIFKLYLIKEFQRLKEEENNIQKIEWDANPELAKSNVRDYATINELTVLSNLESHNAQMIREGRDKMDRFMVLKEIAEYQLRVLNEAAKINIGIEDNL